MVESTQLPCSVLFTSFQKLNLSLQRKNTRSSIHVQRLGTLHYPKSEILREFC